MASSSSCFSKSLFIAAIAVVFGAGCATGPRTTSEVAEILKDSNTTAVDAITQEILAAESESHLAADAGASQKPHHKIPIEINESVRKWIHFFAVRDRDRFQRFLERGEMYRELVQEILQENDIPRELYYLAMIESGFVNHATSRARAVGMWQFIRGTGRRYGLSQNRYVDERRDPVRATRAAARYLKDLHNIFKSWYLAMAAYNAGEYRIIRAIKRGNSRDFWELAEKRILPRETMNYIPKFLAAVIIGRNPEKYGFSRVNATKRYPKVEMVNLPGRVSLREIARVSGVSYSDLKEVNPHIRRGVLPGYSKGYDLWVPADRVGLVRANYAKLMKVKKQRLVAYNARRRSSMKYRVRRGDTLIKISERFGVSVRRLKRLNGIRGNRIIAGESLRIRGGNI